MDSTRAGLFSSIGLKPSLLIWSTSVSSAATTFADRGSPVNKAHLTKEIIFLQVVDDLFIGLARYLYLH